MIVYLGIVMNSSDPTEGIRRAMVASINSEATDSTDADRQRLENEHGKDNVWNTQELSARFEVIGFMAPFCVVKDKTTGKKGSVMFQHMPRFYFGYQPD